MITWRKGRPGPASGSLSAARVGRKLWTTKPPANNTNFAYVGKRTTGTQAGNYLITGPGWIGQAPDGMPQIASPNKSVLVLGRTLVESDSDLSTAYDLAQQIQLTPLSGWQPGIE